MKQPYISFVACSRNDNHGGSLTRRMQIFVDCLSEQCDRHKLPAELVLVEWNPPADRKPLRDELTWRKGDGFCDVRIITVPPEIHRRYKSSESLPLFQMIGKNVGVRRARGEFILCTNIDIIFSDELMQFLAERRLESEVFYRSIRMDVDSNLPEGQPVEEVLKYCRDHIIRVNLPRYSFEFLANNPAAKSSIVKSPNIFLRNGDKFVRSHQLGAPSVLAPSGTEVVFDRAAQGCSPSDALAIELTPTDIPCQDPVHFEFVSSSGEVLKAVDVSSRTTVALPVSDTSGSIKIFAHRVECPDDVSRTESAFCILQVAWINDMPFQAVDYDCYVVGDQVGILGDVSPPEIRSGGRRGISRLVRGDVYLQLPARPSSLKLVFLAVDKNGNTLKKSPAVVFNGTTKLSPIPLPTGHWVCKMPPCSSQNYIWITGTSLSDWYITDVHICQSIFADGLKVLKDHCVRQVEGIFKCPEIWYKTPIVNHGFELSPMNLVLLEKDGVGAYGVEEVAKFLVRKSVKTPQSLHLELMPGYLSGGTIKTVGLRLNGRLLHEVQHPKLPCLDLEMPPMQVGDVLEVEVEGIKKEVPRLRSLELSSLNYRAFLTRISWSKDSKTENQTRFLQDPLWFTFQDVTDCPFVRNPLDMNCSEIPDLFLNACGDFTLAHRETYNRIGGYAEMEIFSMHLDSLFLYSCWFEGFCEFRLPENMVHYHIEHGGGWTPENHERLYRSLASKQIGWLGYNHDLQRLAITMLRLGRPVYFNNADWGLRTAQLEEILPQ